MQRNQIYRIKDGVSVDPQDYFSKYVIVLDVMKDPISKEDYCSFKHIFIDDMRPVNTLTHPSILPVNLFQQNFNLFRG